MQSKLIGNRAKARQLLAFDGLKFGLCRPTDIDLSMDWQCKTFVFVEIKSEGTPLTVGQRIHLSGLCDAIRAGGREAYAIVARHATPVGQDVLCSGCRTSAVYQENKWVEVDTNERLSVTLDILYIEHLVRNER